MLNAPRKVNPLIIDAAHRLLSVLRYLDFKAIVRHDKLAVSQLQQALQVMGVKPGVSRSLQNTSAIPRPIPKASPQLTNVVSTDKRLDIKTALNGEGFADRLGFIYNSESEQRMVNFDKVPHRSGLPTFLFVIAPDFAPIAGYHGIFVTATEVFAAILPATGGGMWKIDERRTYADVPQMAEWVTLLCAGFALP
jgi:hypothetical protein